MVSSTPLRGRFAVFVQVGLSVNRCSVTLSGPGTPYDRKAFCHSHADRQSLKLKSTATHTYSYNAKLSRVGVGEGDFKKYKST